jgi:hypothetical protein
MRPTPTGTVVAGQAATQKNAMNEGGHMALNPFAYGTPLSSFGPQQSPFGMTAYSQQPVHQVLQLLQIVAQQQQQLLQIAQVQQQQLQYLQQIIPQVIQQSQQSFGQLGGGAGFQGITPWAGAPLSGLQANYVM